ncbi:MAG TPA: methylmalonyl-CoA mutase [Myxococcales bacterium]|nr:methylmalonyl-CoA mutase [Myxococcales bacterium]HIN85236.1 methylmalonyl-CoA mutase [Myxococcales bacterium]
MTNKIKDARAQWEEQVLAKSLAKVAKRKDSFTLTDGTAVDDIYVPSESSDYLTQSGFPGEPPFTRGVQPTMYRSRLWTMRQYAGFGTADESNERYRFLLSRGQTGLSVAFDLPTQMGYDSDAVMAAGEVGRTGVAIDSIADMRDLFDQIPLGDVTTSMTINATASILLCMYVAVAEENGVDTSTLRGTVQNDILKEYIARGTYIYPPRQSLRIITDLFAFCKDHLPRWNTISISGYHIREAGSTAAQEVAFTLADGIAYVQAAIDAGLEVDAFARRLAFFFNVHNGFIEEVGKFRAARRLWAKIMRDRFGATDPRSMALRFHTQTGGSTLTAQQVDVNVVRVAIQALAAVLGGTQSLHTNSRDEALALPTESAAELALRTQQVIAHEAGVTEFVDPLGGSYAIESITDHIEAEAEAYIRRIDDMGGMVQAIEAGFVQHEIQDAAYRYQQEIDSSERVIVGVNKFVNDNDSEPELAKIRSGVEADQKARLAAFKASRDAESVASAVQAVEETAQGSDNLMPVILRAVKAGATLGEVSDAMRRQFGEYRERVVV